MLLRLFKGSQPILIFLIPLTVGLVWFKSFLQPAETINGLDQWSMPIFHLIENLLGNHPVIRKIIALALLITNALWLARMNTKFILIKSRTYLPAIFYALICSSFVAFHDLTPALIASFLFIVALEIMFDSYNEEGLSYKFFESAFLVSLASLTYSTIALYLVIIWIILSILRNAGWREWAFTIIGFAIPYLFLYVVYYLTDQNIHVNTQNILSNFIADKGFEFSDLLSMIFYGFLAMIIFIASIRLLSAYQGLKIYIRKFFMVLFVIFLFTLGIHLIFYHKSLELIFFYAIPVSYLLTYYFIQIRSKVMGEILFTIFLALLALLIIF
jgi:hypothetical protein